MWNHFSSAFHRLFRSLTLVIMDFRIVEVSNADKAMLERIGRFRYDLWKGETEVNDAMFPEGIWLEDIDHIARHWVAIGGDDNELLGVARLTIHETLSDNPDGYWVMGSLFSYFRFKLTLVSM